MHRCRRMLAGGRRIEAWTALGVVAIAGCERARPDERRASSDEKPSTAVTTPAQPSPVSAAGTTSSAPTPTVNHGGAPRLLPILDEEKGRQAVQAYVRSLDIYCAQANRQPPSRPAPTTRNARRGPHIAQSQAGLARIPIGFPADAKIEILCVERDTAKPLASGSLIRDGEDEVLLEVPSGRESGNPRALAVLSMENGADNRRHYRVLAHGLSGKAFEARVRLGGLIGRDLLLMCQAFGDTERSPKRCGFLGFGNFPFRYLPLVPEQKANANELELVEISACSASTAVRIGESHATERGLSIELIVENRVRTPGASGKPPGEGTRGPHCSESRVTSSEKFDIDYEWREDRMLRLTSIPKRVARALERKGSSSP